MSAKDFRDKVLTPYPSLREQILERMDMQQYHMEILEKKAKEFHRLQRKGQVSKRAQLRAVEGGHGIFDEVIEE